jgi:hypothetical protein
MCGLLFRSALWRAADQFGELAMDRLPGGARSVVVRTALVPRCVRLFAKAAATAPAGVGEPPPSLVKSRVHQGFFFFLPPPADELGAGCDLGWVPGR